jgi:hypothetical protein
MSLCICPNQILEDGTVTLTLEDFIQHHSQAGKPLLSTNTSPSQWKHIVKGQGLPPLFFEGFINFKLVHNITLSNSKLMVYKIYFDLVSKAVQVGER